LFVNCLPVELLIRLEDTYREIYASHSIQNGEDIGIIKLPEAEIKTSREEEHEAVQIEEE